jgi:hypothetical protein
MHLVIGDSFVFEGSEALKALEARLGHRGRYSRDVFLRRVNPGISAVSLSKDDLPTHGATIRFATGLHRKKCKTS